MNILFSTDSNYFMPTIVSIISIFESNKESEITVYIFYSFLEISQKIIIKDLSIQYNHKIETILIESYYFNNAPVLRWTKETYYRLLVAEKIPLSVSRILYLDSDTIVNNSLINFYREDLGDCCIGALLESNNYKHRGQIGLDNVGGYYQCGVLLIDLVKSREKLGYNNVITIIDKIRYSMIAVDQDVVNVIFDGKIKPIAESFNNCKITNFYGNNLDRLFNKISHKDIENNVIFHYATSKPWNNLYSGSCDKIWYKYLKLSPYVHLYYKKFNTMKFRILRSGIFKFLFFEYIYLTPYINNFFKKIMPEGIYKKMKAFYRINIK